MPIKIFAVILAILASYKVNAESAFEQIMRVNEGLKTAPGSMSDSNDGNVKFMIDSNGERVELFEGLTFRFFHHVKKHEMK